MSVSDILAAARGAAAKPAADKTVESTSEKAPTKAAGESPGKQMSVAEILAAARGAAGPAAAAPKPASTPAEVAKTEKVKASSVNAKPPAEVKPDPQKMSVEQILAAARAGGSGSSSAQPDASPKSPPTAKAVPQQSQAETVVAEVAPAANKSKHSGPLPTSTAEILAFCRKTDG
jgi:hypothetical protein